MEAACARNQRRRVGRLTTSVWSRIDQATRRALRPSMMATGSAALLRARGGLFRDVGCGRGHRHARDASRRELVARRRWAFGLCRQLAAGGRRGRPRGLLLPSGSASPRASASGVGVTSGVGVGVACSQTTSIACWSKLSVPFDLVVPRHGVRAFREVEDAGRRCTAVARGRVEESILDDRSVLVSLVDVECSADRRVGLEMEVERARRRRIARGHSFGVPVVDDDVHAARGPASAAAADTPRRPSARSEAVTPASRLGGRFDLAVSIHSSPD